MIWASEVFDILKGRKEIKTLPSSEYQIRPLVPLREDQEKVVKVWEKAVEKSKDKTPSESIVRNR